MLIVTLSFLLTAPTFAMVGETWQHHIDAWEQRDVDAIAQDYTENSLLILNGNTFRGTDAIKEVFRQLFTIFDSGENRIDPVIIEDRIIYITWHFRPTAQEEFFGTDTFVIEHGKISVQTIASPLYHSFPICREGELCM